MSEKLSSPHYGFLDSYRALLAFGVVLSHTTSLWFSGVVPVNLQWLQVGHPAVCGFIVLSGFVLMLPVMKSGELRGTYKQFMARRARRILPPYYFFVLLTLAMGVFQLLRHGTSNLSVTKAFVELFLMRDFFPYIDNSASGILWTVCIEWKLYFFFPLFVAVLMRRGIVPLAFAAAALTAVWIGLAALVGQSGNWEHTAPWFTLLFCLGMVVCKIAHEPKGFKPIVVLGLGATLGYVASFVATGEVLKQALADVGSGFLLGAFLWLVMQKDVLVKTKEAVIRGLNIKPLVFVGSYGYSIYLFHLFCLRVGLKVARKVADGLHLHGNASYVAALFVCFIFVVVGCYLFYLVAERPWLRSKSKAPILSAS